jgi:hypothetical protein
VRLQESQRSSFASPHLHIHNLNLRVGKDLPIHLLMFPTLQVKLSVASLGCFRVQRDEGPVRSMVLTYGGSGSGQKVRVHSTSAFLDEETLISMP